MPALASQVSNPVSATVLACSHGMKYCRFYSPYMRILVCTLPLHDCHLLLSQ